MIVFPRRTGTDADGLARTETDHFMKCPGCGAWFDMRDLSAVFEHTDELPHRPENQLP
jgi:hypothetical protein